MANVGAGDQNQTKDLFLFDDLDRFFFFKQKTAYEIGVRLVGSEMCIRDRIRDFIVIGRTLVW